VTAASRTMGRPGEVRWAEAEKLLSEQLLESFIKEAAEVREFEATTRNVLVAAAEIAGVLENIKLQSFVRWVSVLALSRCSATSWR
jgi:hypothetical protein